MSATRNSLTPSIGYDIRTGRYRDVRSGQFVSQQTVRRALDSVIDKAAKDARAVTQRLRDGNVSLAGWQREMADTIRRTHGASAAMARGGWAQMTPSDWGRVGQRVRRQYEYLDRFAAQIETGAIPMDGRILSRAELYALDARSQYEADRLTMEGQLGKVRCRSIRSARDSCAGCIAAAGLGWVTLDQMPPPGSRDCGNRCRCHLEFE